MIWNHDAVANKRIDLVVNKELCRPIKRCVELQGFTADPLQRTFIRNCTSYVFSAEFQDQLSFNFLTQIMQTNIVTPTKKTSYLVKVD